MAVKILAQPVYQFFDTNGALLQNGKVYTYIAGTSTNKAAYQDKDKAVSHANPIILDIYGRAEIWWDGIYKINVTDENDVQLPNYPVDNFGANLETTIIGTNNYLLNGSFEAGITLPDNWTATVYPGGTIEFDTSDQQHGSRSLKFISTGNGGGNELSDFFAISPDDIFHISFAIKSSVVDVRNVVDIIWYDEDQILITTTTLYDESVANPASQTTKRYRAAPPATARYARVQIFGCHSSDPTSGSTWFDDILVERVALSQRLGAAINDTDIDSNILTVGMAGRVFSFGGTQDVDEIASIGVGAEIELHHASIRQLTHDATNLILPGEADIITAAGDVSKWREYASGDWRCTNYQATSIFRGARVYDGSSPTIADDTVTALTFNAESYDTDSIHDISSNTSRLTVPAGVTKIRLHGQVRWVANAVGQRRIFLAKNGSGTQGHGEVSQDAVTGAADETYQQVDSGVIAVIAADYFELKVHQESGGNLVISGGSIISYFSMQIIA